MKTLQITTEYKPDYNYAVAFIDGCAIAYYYFSTAIFETTEEDATEDELDEAYDLLVNANEVDNYDVREHGIYGHGY